MSGISSNEYWSSGDAGSKLDLTGYVLTFNDDFSSNSVTTKTGVGPWYSWDTARFGAAKFADTASAVSPFSVADGHLSITMQQVGGQWQSGLIQSVDANGAGFAQQYGYFEMSARLPAGAGAWPAFWLLSKDASQPRVEIDIMEAYGNNISGHYSSLHVTDAASAVADAATAYTKGLGLFDGAYHTFGANITPDAVIIYVDRVEVERFATTDDTHQSFYMLADLAMVTKEASQAAGKYQMDIDYIRAYADPKYTDAVGIQVSSAQGGKGADTLYGKMGADTLVGGAGDDTYIVDNAGDRVIEANGGGTDTVLSYVSFSAVGQSIENIRLLGGGNNSAIGNELANNLQGNSGNNVLDGRGGADTMSGGAGDDTYYVDNPGDRVVEAVGGGNDWVRTSISYSLESTEVENIRVEGSSSVRLTGNAYDNIMSGGGGSDTISGGDGADTICGFGGYDVLTGGAGADRFSFSSTLTSKSADTITDFQHGVDVIALDDTTFVGLNIGALPSAAFYAGAAAHDTDDRIIYDRSSGAIYFDSDGTGPTGMVRIATITTGSTLSASDFIVF